jgi:hypothetical protein
LLAVLPTHEFLGVEIGLLLTMLPTGDSLGNGTAGSLLETSGGASTWAEGVGGGGSGGGDDGGGGGGLVDEGIHPRALECEA